MKSKGFCFCIPSCGGKKSKADSEGASSPKSSSHSKSGKSRDVADADTVGHAGAATHGGATGATHASSADAGAGSALVAMSAANVSAMGSECGNGGGGDG
ncbi:hypothetical protein NMG60_11034112 [Bertholletia excelsa]